jgi:integrase
LADGKRRALYGKTRRDVQLKLNAVRRAIEDGLSVSPERQTVTGFLEQWLEAASPTVRPKTFETYSLNVRRMTPRLGSRRLSSLNPADMQGCYPGLLERGPSKRTASGLSRRSVRQVHEMLHRASKQAVEWGMTARNPADAVSPPRPERKEMATLSEPQVQKLFESSAADRYHALWVLLVTAGLRLGEATGLRWPDIDLEAGSLTVQRALQRRRNSGLVLVEPTSNHSRRTVHLADETAAELWADRKRQAGERLAVGPLWEDQGLVFPSLDGGPLAPETITGGLHRPLAKLRLKPTSEGASDAAVTRAPDAVG